MTGDTHYDLDTLADLAEGLLDAAAASRVREHLAVCDPCGELLADLAAVREVLAATPTPAMPMGVALRVDKALAAEAGSRRGGVGLVETPDWDELMRDTPWERPAEAPGQIPQEAEPEPVRLGVVSDDGTIVPARTRTTRKRRWAMPAVAAAAAAAVVGTAVAATNLLVAAGGDGGTARPPVALSSSSAPKVTRSPQRATPYTMTDSNYNYSDHDLRRPLQSLFGPMPMLGGDDAKADKVATCVGKVGERSGLSVFAVDQGQYNGQEALVVASRRNEAAKKIRIDIVDPFNCKNLRKPTLGRW